MASSDARRRPARVGIIGTGFIGGGLARRIAEVVAVRRDGSRPLA